MKLAPHPAFPLGRGGFGRGVRGIAAEEKAVLEKQKFNWVFFIINP